MNPEKLIKGNYKLPENATQQQSGQTDTEGPAERNYLEQVFEIEALKKLKGSIAFVRKSGNPFVIKQGGKKDGQ